MLPRRLSNIRYLLALVSAFLVLALSYSFIVPPFESPDEAGHFAYIVHLRTTRSLPVQRTGELGEAHQPPLYYVIAALASMPASLADQAVLFRSNPEFVWAGQGGHDVNAMLHGSAETFPFRGASLALHLARVSSVFMGMITVAFTTLIAWKVFPNHPTIGLLAGALVAFNPQFLFISGSVNNDNLLTMVATVSWWQVLRAIAQPEQRRQWAYVGVLIGVGLLTKVNGGLVIGLVAGIMLLIRAFGSRSVKLPVNGALSMAAVAALSSGWWFARNQLLYGDLLGWSVYREVFAVNLRDSALQWGDLKDFFSVQFRSFWGVFGWVNVPCPDWFYRAFGVLCFLSLLGLGTRALRRRLSRPGGSEDRTLPMALLFVASLAQEAYMLAVITRCNPSCYQGRYLFPVIAPLMIIMSWGLSGFLPQRRRPASISVMVIVSVLVSLALFAPVKVIAPAYETVPMAAWRLWLVPNKTSFEFRDMFRLRGYDWHMDKDNTAVVLTLYWQTLERPDFNYSVFAHLIDESNQIVAQKDHAPGEEHDYPPVAWWPGDIIADEHRIEVPLQLAPGSYRFRIGVYNWATGEQLPALGNGDYVGDFVILDRSVER